MTIQSLLLAALVAACVMPALPALAQTCPPGANWCSGTYAYDGMGNIRAMGSDIYIYDTVGRLVSGTADVNRTGILSRQNYAYDAFGNCTSASRIQGSIDCLGGCEQSPTIDPNTNHIISNGAQYDDAGNLISITNTVNGTAYTSTYTYDAAGNLSRATAGSDDRQFLYTADGERIATRNGQSWTWTIRGLDGKVLREFTSLETSASPLVLSNHTWSKDYIWRDGQLLATVEPTTPGANTTITKHFHLDHLGTPRVVSNDAGVQIATHAYYPFGAELNLGLSEQPGELMKFTGHERDLLASNPNTLDYMHARYYSPTAGRFLSVDPSMDLKKTIQSPQMWNRYSYVVNNPLRYTDPDGRDIYAQVQEVTGGNDYAHLPTDYQYHVSLRIEPNDQQAWSDARFANVNPATGRKYATIGAGPEHGLGSLIGKAGHLISGINRPRDVDLSIKVIEIKLNLKGRDENTVITTLFAANAAYKNNAQYELFPFSSNAYNSNSFAAGLMMAAGLQLPTIRLSVPGYDKPLPLDFLKPGPP
jgi:RHS repeat-associated protein